MVQRTYRAACPNCGAPVDFQSGASALAVCGYCRSTVVREGDVLRRIGQMSEPFDDHSPLQLGAGGRESGESFTLVGRLQYRYAEGTWNEWHVLFDSGRLAWLSEDNGRYVLMQDMGLRPNAPAAASIRPGARITVEGAGFTVASLTQARLIAAQGELPFAPTLEQPFTLIDARSTDGRVATLDYSDSAAGGARLYVGKPVSLRELSMQGLRLETEATIKGRAFSCPSCGAPIEVKLDGAKSLTCGACSAVIDLSQGTAGAIPFERQAMPRESPIPLGSTGSLEGIEWQAVGFMRRHGVDDEGEHFDWHEVLLYNRIEGFAFLVIASDGVSLVRPVQEGVQQTSYGTATYRKATYTGEAPYTSNVTYVAGEFYWQVKVGQTARVTDFRSGDRVLSAEESEGELVWSEGARISPAAVASGFKVKVPALMAGIGAASALAATAGAATAGAIAPTSGSSAVFWIIVMVVVLIAIFVALADDDGSGGGGYVGSGGSYSGARHK